jgi:hypothetical protein
MADTRNYLDNQYLKPTDFDFHDTNNITWYEPYQKTYNITINVDFIPNNDDWENCGGYIP